MACSGISWQNVKSANLHCIVSVLRHGDHQISHRCAFIWNWSTFCNNEAQSDHYSWQHIHIIVKHIPNFEQTHKRHAICPVKRNYTYPNTYIHIYKYIYAYNEKNHIRETKILLLQNPMYNKTSSASFGKGTIYIRHIKIALPAFEWCAILLCT